MLESVYLTKSKVRGRLLGLLFTSPAKRYYLSELARLVGTSPGNVQRELRRFFRDELILSEKRGNMTFYYLNSRHALFQEIRSLVMKTFGIEGELQALVQKDRGIKLALLYGSFARGEEKGESDIDVLMVADKELEKFYSALAKLESRFNREINPTAYSPDELRKKIAARDSFVLHVLNQPYRLLKGNLRDFQKSAA